MEGEVFWVVFQAVFGLVVGVGAGLFVLVLMVFEIGRKP